MRLSLLGACPIVAIVGLAAFPLAADSQFVRELDAYCISSDGTREGVSASQDGATNSYVQRPGETLEIMRGVHSRRTVSLWHAELDAAGFDAMEGPELDAPYCAIERVQGGQMHGLQWREDEAPAALVNIIAAMLGEELNSNRIEQ